MVDDPFANMLARMDRAEGCADVAHGVFERLKHPERTLKMTLPVEPESGEVEVFEGNRCQFDSARRPFKGGIRFHPSVSQREAEALAERDVQVVPDILANAGGVIVSYLKWVQNAQEFSWPLETVNAELKRRIGSAFDETIEQYDEKDLPDLRTAAYTLALERTAKAHEYRGLFS